MSLNLDSFVAVPIPCDLYNELARRFPGGFSSVIENIAQDFLERTADDFAAGTGRAGSVYWEALLLPAGTEIRTKHHGVYKTAEITAGQIVWEGEAYPSMSRLASAMRGDTSNNAWKVLEIKRPTDGKWQPADHLRR
jgi:hypothetical protein